ncbi:hypothetical protein NQ176_g5885 [Zarea fungicola]|uniref:Uncharacterized protein n=1 Tax=Zarea fungicola TaxID=93591 RepID=A0ACC1N8I2_9HYPO|nr:hypothetical protein NQ176_g5885 [Lecanicillium fungicola]
MSFEKLPSEIFVQVLECLPSSFFRQDLHRLHITKRWYECAYPVLFRDLEFTATSLHQFITAVRTYPRVAAQLRHVRSMTTTLHGFDDWASPRLLPEFSAVNLDVVNDWTSALNRDLGLLARLLPRLVRLEKRADVARRLHGQPDEPRL